MPTAVIKGQTLLSDGNNKAHSARIREGEGAQRRQIRVDLSGGVSTPGAK